MSIGANISVITAGAVLTFAVRAHASGFSVQAVGAVLMAVGAVSLAMQIRALARQRELTAAQAEQPQDAVLVRPSGPLQTSYGPQHTATMPLTQGRSPYRNADQYTGNEW